MLFSMLFLASSSKVWSQGVQAIRGVSETAVQRQVDLLSIAVQQSLMTMLRLEFEKTVAGRQDTQPAVARE